MTALLELKQRLKIFYSRNDVYLRPLLKFLLALVSLLLLNSQIGFMKRVANPVISLLLSLICALLPVNALAVIGGLLLCAHAYALSIEVFAMAAGLLAVMYLIYFRVSPGYGVVLTLTPLAFFFRIPYALPLVLGLIGGPVCVVPLACGTILYYFMYYMKMNETMLSNAGDEQLVSRLTYLIENVLNNRNVLLTILVFTVTMLVVYAVHRSSVDYAWYLAIASGAVVNLVLFLVGGLALNVKVSILGLILGTVAAAALAVVVEFFVLSVDYSRTEYAQFEDDEYYYYVKAVPKMSIAVADKKVKKISSRSRGARKRP